MRTFSSILALSAFAAGAMAKFGRAPACMNDKAAQQVATNFKNLIAEYSDELADAVLTTDFTDYSDSVNELINSGCTGPQAVRQDRWNVVQCCLTARLTNRSLAARPSAPLRSSRPARANSPPFVRYSDIAYVFIPHNTNLRYNSL